MSNYGEVGVNIGSVGRWTRLAMGMAIVVLVATDFQPTTHTQDLAFYLMTVSSFMAITAIYTLVHVLLGDKLCGQSARCSTLIFVGPTMFLLLSPAINPALQVGQWLSLPQLNHPFRLALFLYIGVSMFSPWRARDGGCEVLSIPNFLFKKNYGSHRVPLLPLDVAEKFISDKLTKRSSAEGT